MSHEEDEGGGTPIFPDLSARVLGFHTQSSVTRFYLQVTIETNHLRSFVVEKRYREFDAFRAQLGLVCAHPPALPGKTWTKRFDPVFLHQRAKALAVFLRNVVSSQMLLSTPAAQLFFFSDLCQAPDDLVLVDVGTPLMTPGGDGRWTLGWESALPPSSSDLQREFASAGLSFAAGDMIPERSKPGTSNHWNLWGACTSCTSEVGEGESKLREGSLSSLTTEEEDEGGDEEEAEHERRTMPTPPLRVVFLLVGSRGDVQPYVAMGKALQRCGHSVRIATHECFREWIVRDHGLDFMPIAGDPKLLLAMVVENKMFSYTFVKNGMTTHRSWIYQVLLDCWRACVTPSHMAVNHATKPHGWETDVGPGKAFSRLESQEYRADVIVANPPSFAGWHIAEALGVPLISTFPMPWTRTKAFPSPFTSLGDGTSGRVNWMSFGAVDRMIWMGMGDLVNAFRTKELALKPIWTYSAKGHRYIHDYRVPCLYCWSPSVLDKPRDWGKHVVVNGYMFLPDSDGAQWEPSDVLLRCFDSPTRRVVFIGFGSIVVRNPDHLSKTIEQVARVLIQKHDCHVLVQKGWTGVELDGNVAGLFQIGSAPHAWVFKRCAVVVHHGGAGTTSTALQFGVPSVIVPFFGDQFFWGKTLQRKGLGESEPYGPKLTVARLVECVETCLFSSAVREKCQRVAVEIAEENGVDRAVELVHSVVWGTKVFDKLQQHHQTSELRDWRIYPYFNLKRRVKQQRLEHPNGMRGKVKATFRGFTSSQRQVGGCKGLELVGEEDEDGDELQRQRSMTFAFPPDLQSPPPEPAPGHIPQGHTAFSWLQGATGPPPQGHTRFSWSITL